MKNFLLIGHLVSTSSNYHIIVQQLHNNLRPTRYLRTKFLANSRRIKNASEQYGLRLISTWQFLQICSHVTGAYELRQRNWALRNNTDQELVLPAEYPAPNNVPMVVNPVPHNVPDAVNQQAANQNHDIIREILLEQENNDMLDNQLIQVPDAVQIQQDNRNVCMTCISESNEQYIVLPYGHAWVCGVCVIQLQQENTACPMCRARNVRYQRMFFS